MSIFSKALELLKGKQKEKELQEQLNNEKQITKEQQNLITALANENAKLQQPCKNKLVYNANNQYVVVIDCNDDTFEGYVSPEKVEKLKTATTEEIIALLTPPKEEKTEENSIEKEEKEIVSNFLDIFDGVDDFEVIGNSLFFKNIHSVEIPSLIVARFVELIEKISYYKEQFFDDHAAFETEDTLQLTSLEQEYQSLKAFTLKLLLNPLQESREDCLTYVRNFNIKLTTTGNMIMYRRIVAKNDDNKDLVEFVSKQYLKIKSWKKSPKNYWVNIQRETENTLMLVEDKIHELNLDGCLGNLAELYNNLSELQENRYTDDYTNSYDIRIGSTYKIREEDININRSGSCGGALHVADGKKFNYSGFGNTPVVCLISPQHVYKLDSGCSGKIGVKQMFIAAVTTQDEEGNYEDIDNQDLVNFDELYHNESIEELTEALKTKSLEVTSVSTAISEVSLKDVQNIKDLLSKRVVNI